jgi:uncharacterized repeat protein (TIGR03803 family)
MRKSKWWIRACAVAMLSAVAAAGASAQQGLQSLANFDQTNGADPQSAMVEGTDANLYGTTSGGGLNNDGVIFRIGPNGILTTLYNFCSQANCADGANPGAGLVLAGHGYLYGATANGGANSSGTVYRTTLAGAVSTLYSFCALPNCTDGSSPNGLVVGANGNFYGTTQYGGSNGTGTVFRMSPSGALTTLYNFCSQPNCADGSSPAATVVLGTDRNFYGTTQAGGLYGAGTIFRITQNGALTTLYSFCAQANCTDGTTPLAPLVQAANGNFYGMAQGGLNGSGTVFEITFTGTFTNLYSFCSVPDCLDGAGVPHSGLIQATDGNLYGIIGSGGASNDGTIFNITPAGALTTLQSFNATDGANPSGGLLQATNGNFYGTTDAAGADNDGTVYRLDAGLSPFVETVPATGIVGAEVKIVGSNLAGATSVTFNGVPAAFTLPLRTAISTHVPVGATTGPVQVVIPTGTLTSNANFQVEPK